MRLFDAGARGDDPGIVHDRILTVANAITMLRLAGLPLFVWLMTGPAAYGMAFAVLVAIGTTDWVDGYVARRFDQVTRLGRVLDPLIDRLLLATAAVTLVVVGFFPLLLALLLVVRDVVLVVMAVVRYGALPPIPVSRMGKFATACLLIGVPGFLLANMTWQGAALLDRLAWLLTIVGLIAYYAAGVSYARVARALPRPSRGLP